MYNWFLSKATRISMWVFLFNFGSMEKSKVIRVFTCVNSRIRYSVGDTYEADVNRINQLASKGYVKPLEVAHVPKAEVKPPSKAEVSQPTKKPKKAK